MTLTELAQQLETALNRISVLERKLSTQDSQSIHVEEFGLGAGDSSIKMSREGFWVGKNTFAQTTTNPPAGTAIALNGDIYPKGGVNGSFTSADGTPKTITVTRGIITGIS